MHMQNEPGTAVLFLSKLEGRPCDIMLYAGAGVQIEVSCLLDEPCPWRKREGHRTCCFPWEGVVEQVEKGVQP